MQCTWGKETAKKARTQQHFESLVNHIKALEAKVKDLEADLDICQKTHGGTRAASSSSDIGTSRYSRPAGLGEPSSSKVEEDEQGLGEESESPSDSTNGDANIDRLIAPTRHLVVSCRIYIFFLLCHAINDYHCYIYIAVAPGKRSRTLWTHVDLQIGARTLIPICR